MLPLENQSFVCLRATVSTPIMRSETSQERDRKEARRIHRSSYWGHFVVVVSHFKAQVNRNLLISAASSVNPKHGGLMALSRTGVLMGPQEKNKILNKIKRGKQTLRANQDT